MDLKCHVCGHSIEGRYRMDRYNNCVCENHLNTPLCFCCGRFCNNSARYVSNNQMVCITCQQKRIENDSAARMIPFVYKVYGDLGFRLPGYKVKLVSVSEMQKLYKMEDDSFPLGLAHFNGKDYTIFVIHDISRIKFVEVIAHEILHTWQWQRSINPPDIICEGFCNFGAYLVLKELMKNHPTDETDMALWSLMKNPDEIYGDGFRELRDIYDIRGFKAVIEYIKQWQIMI